MRVHTVAESPESDSVGAWQLITMSHQVRKSFSFQFSFSIFGLHEKGDLMFVLFFLNISLILDSPPFYKGKVKFRLTSFSRKLYFMSSFCKIALVLFIFIIIFYLWQPILVFQVVICYLFL